MMQTAQRSMGPIEAQARARKAELHRQWFTPHAKPEAPSAPILLLQAPIVSAERVALPLWKTTQTGFDQHVIDMRVAVGEITLAPAAYLRHRCQLLGYDYNLVIGRDRSRKAVVPMRDRMILEIKTVYPHLSLPQMGRIFGGRDHTTILHSLRKQGVEPCEAKTPLMDHAETIRKMWDDGESQWAIARVVGRNQAAIARFIKKQGWSR